MDIVLNDCFGGYGLSHEALLAIYALNPQAEALDVVSPEAASRDPWYHRNLFAQALDGNFLGAKLSHAFAVRGCPELVTVVRQLGSRANDSTARLKLVTLADASDCRIIERDGLEKIEYSHAN